MSRRRTADWLARGMACSAISGVFLARLGTWNALAAFIAAVVGLCCLWLDTRLKREDARDAQE